MRPASVSTGWDGTMKSLLNEALARHQEAEAKEEREAAKAAKTPEKGKNNDDQEIEKIVESINVSIKIVGCGGGGGETGHPGGGGRRTGAPPPAPDTEGENPLSLPPPQKKPNGKRRPKGPRAPGPPPPAE